VFDPRLIYVNVPMRGIDMPGQPFMRNPGRTPGAIRRRISELQIELGDQRYFGAPTEVILGLEEEIDALGAELAHAEQAYETGVRGALRRTRQEEEHAEWRRRHSTNPYVRHNPLLAIVGNPRNPIHYGEEGGHDVAALAFEARHRFLEDMEAGHLDAAEFWRGQAGAFFTGPGPVHPGDWDELERLERELARKGQTQVAGGDPLGSLKSRSKKKRKKSVKKNRTMPKGKKKPQAKKKRFSIEQARERFEGVDEAVKAYKRFHGKSPSHVDVYVLDDGRDDVTLDRAHAALHRTIDTNYFVPWDSNKKDTLWKHEHVEGYDLHSQKQLPPAEDFPLEILDPRTGTTRKILGRFQVTDWWHD